MDKCKTRKFWFLVLNFSICLSFCCYTIVNSFHASSKTYTENFSEKDLESKEKVSENSNAFYLIEENLELELFAYDYPENNSANLAFIIPLFWPSPTTPPPDLV